MKSFVVILFFQLFSIILFAQAELEFQKEYITLGKLNLEDEYVVCKAFYKNIGNLPLYLTSYTTTCPCVEVDYSEEAIAPGDSAFITIKYTFRYEGKFRQSISMHYFMPDADQDPRKIVTIIGNVIGKKDDEVLTKEELSQS